MTAGDGMSWTRSGLAHAAGVSTSVVDGLVDAGDFRNDLSGAAADRRQTRS
jgi:hypothetical protein